MPLKLPRTGLCLCVCVKAGAGRTVQQGFQEFSQTMRWSAGVGLVLPTWFGRFEINYVTLLSHQRHDRTKPGLQLGFATSAFM